MPANAVRATKKIPLTVTRRSSAIGVSGTPKAFAACARKSLTLRPLSCASSRRLGTNAAGWM